MLPEIDFVTEVIDNQPLGADQRLITLACPEVPKEPSPANLSPCLAVVSYVVLGLLALIRVAVQSRSADEQGEDMADILLPCARASQVLSPMGHGYISTD